MGDSVNIPKFGLFGDDEEGSAAPDSKQGVKTPVKGPQQGPGSKGPQQAGPQKGQATPGQGQKPGQGPTGQQAPKPGQGPPAPGAKQGGPSQQTPGKPGPKQQGPPGAKPGEPAKTGAQKGPEKPGGGLCPLCKTTQLNTGSKEPPNYSNCTECKSQVCSLCGFSPPDSAVRRQIHDMTFLFGFILFTNLKGSFFTCARINDLFRQKKTLNKLI